jgi:hypothetical protein
MRRRIFQEAYYVRSVDETAARWARDLGAGPFFAVRRQGTDFFSYRGSPIEAEVSYAFGYLGDMMIQFIEQHDNLPSIYRDMYADGEEGFHHFGYLVSDYAAERDRLIACGYDLATELAVDGVNACYLDTRPLNGAFTELHGDPPHMLGLFEQWRRLHETRQADLPAVMEIADMPGYTVAAPVPLTGDTPAAPRTPSRAYSLF